jgi:hypothetical protein
MGLEKLNTGTEHGLAQGGITNFPCNIERGFTVLEFSVTFTHI